MVAVEDIMARWWVLQWRFRVRYALNDMSVASVGEQYVELGDDNTVKIILLRIKR